MAAAGRSPAQTFALVFGVVYVVVALVGFSVVQLDPFAENSDKEIFGIFEVNGLHNIVHLLIGALFLVGSRSHAGAKTMNTLIGAVYVLVGILGIPQVLVEDLLSNNAADTVLHLVSGLLALYFGTAGAESGTRTTTVGT